MYFVWVNKGSYNRHLVFGLFPLKYVELHALLTVKGERWDEKLIM